MRAELHPAARAELIAIARYIEQRRTGYGRRFLRAFAHARDYVLMYPRGSPQTRGGRRRKQIIGFKHDIIYRIERDLIFIIAIAHHRRKPFWSRRRRR